MTAPSRMIRAVSTIAVLVLAAGCANTRNEATTHQHPPPATGYGIEAEFGVQRVRAATAAFVSLDSAVAAGYAPTVAQCIAHPDHGAMGFHHVNRALMDAQLEVERPEILVYERLADGRYVLNGIEYIVPYSRWSRDSAPPTVLGQHLKRADDLRLWYLHVWVWRENPAGLFADWNPAVHCHAG